MIYIKNNKPRNTQTKNREVKLLTRTTINVSLKVVFHHFHQVIQMWTLISTMKWTKIKVKEIRSIACTPYYSLIYSVDKIFISYKISIIFYLFIQIIMMNITTESTQIHTTHKIHLINYQIVPMIFLMIYTKSNFRKDLENLRASGSPLTLGLIQVQRKSYKK